jgi:hypothetical protein
MRYRNQKRGNRERQRAGRAETKRSKSAEGSRERQEKDNRPRGGVVRRETLTKEYQEYKAKPEGSA